LSDEVPEVPAIGISFHLPLDDGTGRHIVFQSHVPQSSSLDEMNNLLDKMSHAGERQKSLVLLPTYKTKLEEAKVALESETKNLFQATSEKEAMSSSWREQSSNSQRRNWQPAPDQRKLAEKISARIQQHEQNMRVLEKRIVSEENRISIYERRLDLGA
jgi:hypothetical protein